MHPAIRTDPATGLKAFNTRAAKASARIAGQGYAAATAETQTDLPPPPPGARFRRRAPCIIAATVTRLRTAPPQISSRWL